jgi:phosphoglycerate dehydrogenase-like enzyme
MHSATTAEHVLALMLAMSRGLPRCAVAQTEKRWLVLDAEQVRVLAGSRLTVVGTGNIGRAIARQALAFEMEVSGVNRRGGAATGFSTVRRSGDLAQAVRGADWVVLACPLTVQTHHLVGADVLREMSGSAILVNVSRGPVVNGAALVTALRECWIGGAALASSTRSPCHQAPPCGSSRMCWHVGLLMPG